LGKGGKGPLKKERGYYLERGKGYFEVEEKRSSTSKKENQRKEETPQGGKSA